MDDALLNPQAEGAQAKRQARIALLVRLTGGDYAMPVERVVQIVGPAELRGESDEIFLGWLSLYGEPIPVFDLNQTICEVPAPMNFGSRIAIVDVGKGASARRIGLLAPGLTDTVPANAAGIEPLPLEMYCSMLVPLIPDLPADAA